MSLLKTLFTSRIACLFDACALLRACFCHSFVIRCYFMPVLLFKNVENIIKEWVCCKCIIVSNFLIILGLSKSHFLQCKFCMVCATSASQVSDLYSSCDNFFKQLTHFFFFLMWFIFKKGDPLAKKAGLYIKTINLVKMLDALQYKQIFVENSILQHIFPTSP